MPRPLSVLLTLALLLGACGRGGSQASDGGPGTIRGRVLLGPTCPVEQVSSPCAPRPMPHVLVRVVDANGSVLADATSDDTGRFDLAVEAGSYLLTASIDEDPGRSVEPTRVQVTAGSVVRANVLVDSGIR